MFASSLCCQIITFHIIYDWQVASVLKPLSVAQMLRLFSQFLDALKSVPDSGFFQLFSFASGAAAKIVLS